MDWDREVEPTASAKVAQLIRGEAARIRPRSRRAGFEALESLELPAPERVDKEMRVERLRSSLARRAADAPPAERPDPDLVREVVKGAETALAKVADPAARFSFRERAGLEAVVMTDGTRPSLTVREGFVDLANPEIGEWDVALRQFEPQIRKVIAAIGRINIPIGPGFAGTCFAIVPGLVVTNRHVLEVIARQGSDGAWTLSWPGQTTIDFIAEDGAAKATRYPVTSVRFAGPDAINETIDFAHLDLAILAIGGDAGFPAAVNLEKDAAALGNSRDLYLVGFPGRPHTYFGAGPPPPQHETNAVMSSLFKWKFGVKKLAPGRIDAIPPVNPTDAKAWIFSHDASTLAGNSGSAVVDLGTDGGRVLGLHFGGVARDENWAHAFAKLQNELKPFNPTWV